MEVKVGMQLASKVDEQWYRVMVLSIKDMSRVRIFLKDYGIIMTVLVSSLRPKIESQSPD